VLRVIKPEAEECFTLKDEAEGFEKSLLPRVFGLAAGEGPRSSPERFSVLRLQGWRKGGLSSL
jgi:hypothetical protein